MSPFVWKTVVLLLALQAMTSSLSSHRVRKAKNRGGKKHILLDERLQYLINLENGILSDPALPVPESSIKRRRRSGPRKYVAIKRSKKLSEQDIRESDIENIQILSPDKVEVALKNGTTFQVDPRDLHQREHEDLWLTIRSSLMVTASEFSSVLGTSFFTSREHLMETKLGQRPRFAGNAACTWGLRMEPHALRQYVEATGNQVKETGLHVHDNLKIGASPDGLVSDQEGSEGLLEIKCLYGQRTKQQLKEYEYCPRRYYDQIQGQLEVCDKPWCDLIIWIPKNSKGKNYSILRVRRNQTHWETCLAPAMDEFCKELEMMHARIGI